MSKQTRLISAGPPDALLGCVVAILEQDRGNVIRAEYGKQVVEALSARLIEQYGKGFSPTTLQYFRKFYLAYQDRCAEIPRPAGAELTQSMKCYPAGTESPQGFSHHLSWSPYLTLMRIENVTARTIKNILELKPQGNNRDAA